MSADDESLLDHTAELSRRSMDEHAGGPFGALIARNGKVIAEGWNQVTASNDPTAHAEIVAIRRACKELGVFSLEGTTLYTSCEPCPMCLAAAYWARVDRIVYANTRHQAADAGFDDAFIYDEIPLPPQERSVPMRHIARDSAADVFDDWILKADKVPY